MEEVANALRRAIKLERIFEEDAQEALKALEDMRIELYELDWAQIFQGLSIACDLDLTIYDTSYLYLADKIKAHLITADKGLYETAKEHFRTCSLRTTCKSLSNCFVIRHQEIVKVRLTSPSIIATVATLPALAIPHSSTQKPNSQKPAKDRIVLPKAFVKMLDNNPCSTALIHPLFIQILT